MSEFSNDILSLFFIQYTRELTYGHVLVADLTGSYQRQEKTDSFRLAAPILLMIKRIRK